MLSTLDAYAKVDRAEAKYNARQLKRLTTAYRLITENHVDSLDAARLVERAIGAMFDGLDPHSTYTSADRVGSHASATEESPNDAGAKTVFGYRASEDVGYIKITRFANNTPAETEVLLESLAGIKSLIMDLRDNVGGTAVAVRDVAALFMNKGELIFSAENRCQTPITVKTISDGRYRGIRLVVLVNGRSASASELFAGAMQDWDRATVIGSKSFGKGLIQKSFRLDDGARIKISAYRYRTPSGRAIQRPYEPGNRAKYYSAERDTCIVCPEYRTLRAGRIVYGNDGITPDIETAATPDYLTPFYAEVVSKKIYLAVLERWLADKMEELKREFPSYERFRAEFRLPKGFMSEIIEAAKAENLNLEGSDAKPTASRICALATAETALRLFSMAEYYRTLNESGDGAYGVAMTYLRE